MVVVVVIAGLPAAEVPALPPPVTLRSELVVPERDRTSLVVSPEPVFEGAGVDQTETPLEVASPDEGPGGTQAVSGDSPDTEIPEPTAVDSPDETPVPGDGPDPTESADSPDADSPDGADSPDD